MTTSRYLRTPFWTPKRSVYATLWGWSSCVCSQPNCSQMHRSFLVFAGFEEWSQGAGDLFSFSMRFRPTWLILLILSSSLKVQLVSVLRKRTFLVFDTGRNTFCNIIDCLVFCVTYFVPNFSSLCLTLCLCSVVCSTIQMFFLSYNPWLSTPAHSPRIDIRYARIPL